jgi:ferredoxin
MPFVHIEETEDDFQNDRVAEAIRKAAERAGVDLGDEKEGEDE